MTVRVIVAMAARDTVDRAVWETVARDHGAEFAYLHVGDPSLSRVLDGLAAGGCAEVRLVGVTLGPVAPAASWLRRIAAHWWRELGPAAPRIEVAPSIVKSTDAAELEGAFTAPGRMVTGREAGLTSQAWEEIPGYAQMTLVCRGPRCTARGADMSAAALSERMNERGLGDDDVLVVQTGCMFPCNHAPVVVVQPDDVWYGGVDERTAARIVDDHICEGRIVEDARVAR